MNGVLAICLLYVDVFTLYLALLCYTYAQEMRREDGPPGKLAGSHGRSPPLQECDGEPGGVRDQGKFTTGSHKCDNRHTIAMVDDWKILSAEGE